MRPGQVENITENTTRTFVNCDGRSLNSSPAGKRPEQTVRQRNERAVPLRKFAIDVQGTVAFIRRYDTCKHINQERSRYRVRSTSPESSGTWSLYLGLDLEPGRNHPATVDLFH